MAEKEERILVRSFFGNPCTDCEGEPCSDCVICGNDLAWDASIPRKEAILKMAKKRFEAEYGKKWEETTDEFRGAFLKTAETMLDALLNE